MLRTLSSLRRRAILAFDVFRRADTGATAGQLARWIVTRQFVVYGRELLSRPPDRFLDEKFRLEPLEAKAWNALLQLQPGLSRFEVRRRVDAGAGCTVVWNEDRLVYSRWHTRRPFDLEFLPLQFVPNRGELLIFDAYAHPEFRGRWLHSAVSEADLARAWDNDIRRIIALIPGWNRASRLVAARAGGMRPIGSLTYAPFSRRHRLDSRGNLDLGPGATVRVAGVARSLPGAPW